MSAGLVPGFPAITNFTGYNDASTEKAAAPAAPTVANVGTPGAVTHSYQVVANDGTSDSPASPATATNTSNAVLSVSNYNTVSWTAVSGAVSYKVLRDGQLLKANASTPYSDNGTDAPTAYAATEGSLLQAVTFNSTFSYAINGTVTTFYKGRTEDLPRNVADELVTGGFAVRA